MGADGTDNKDSFPSVLIRDIRGQISLFPPPPKKANQRGTEDTEKDVLIHRFHRLHRLKGGKSVLLLIQLCVCCADFSGGFGELGGVGLTRSQQGGDDLAAGVG